MRELSRVHKEELIKRGHTSKDLRCFSFFLDIQTQRTPQVSTAQLINSHLKKYQFKNLGQKSVTRFKYQPDTIDYIVVEDNFLEQVIAGTSLGNVLVKSQVFKSLDGPVKSFYRRLFDDKVIKSRG